MPMYIHHPGDELLTLMAAVLYRTVPAITSKWNGTEVLRILGRWSLSEGWDDSVLGAVQLWAD
jgi:hypothetical protein